ncbi:VC0807 family protein [Nonomuraea sp. NPDC049784]|uniref:VC0807 family protein n=1 Tax=Nonomuraea sp. NPDC049784 TaxID=3154361 RepID=UPI0033FE3F05
MNRSALIKGVLADVVLPVAVYYVCRAVGLDQMPALLLGGLAALLRIAIVAARLRRFDGLAALVAAGFGVAIVLAALTGDPRLVLAKESIVSGLLGLLLLGSCLVGRPLMYALMRRLNAEDHDKLAEWARLWQARPEFRRVFTTITLVWGAGALAEALVRLPLIYSIPLDVMTGVSTALQLGTIVVLMAWTLLYRKRRAEKAVR